MMAESGPAGSAERPACGSVTRGSNLLAGGITIAQLAGVLTRRVDRVVIDSTGLTGSFDVDLRWSTAAGASAPLGGAALDDGPSIFTAVREQLGLELEPQRAAVEVLVVDRVERPTEN